MKRKIALGRMATHDFNRAIRCWKKLLPEKDIIKLLVDERRKAQKTAVRGLGVAMIGTMWLLANKQALALKLPLVELSIPVAYVNFFIAATLMSVVLHILSFFYLGEYIWLVCTRLLKFDAAWALTAVYDGDSVWSNASIPQRRFFASNSLHKRFANISFFLSSLPVVALVGFAYFTVFIAGLHVLDQLGIMSTDGILTIMAWVFLGYGLAQIVVPFIPFTFAKNQRFVRWRFLYLLHRREGRFPGRASIWAQEAQTSAT